MFYVFNEFIFVRKSMNLGCIAVTIQDTFNPLTVCKYFVYICVARMLWYPRVCQMTAGFFPTMWVMGLSDLGVGYLYLLKHLTDLMCVS